MFQATPKNHSGPGSRKLPRVVNNADLLGTATAPQQQLHQACSSWQNFTHIFEEEQKWSRRVFFVYTFFKFHLGSEQFVDSFTQEVSVALIRTLLC